MNLAAAVGTALKEGGPAAGVLILFYVLGWFDLPLPGKLPPEAAIAKPVLALLGALAAYRFLPRRKGRRFLVVLLVFAAGAASFGFYRHYNDVPAPPELVNTYVTGAVVALGATYFFLGALLRELIVTLLVVFRIQKPR